MNWPCELFRKLVLNKKLIVKINKKLYNLYIRRKVSDTIRKGSITFYGRVLRISPMRLAELIFICFHDNKTKEPVSPRWTLQEVSITHQDHSLENNRIFGKSRSFELVRCGPKKKGKNTENERGSTRQKWKPEEENTRNVVYNWLKRVNTHTRVCFYNKILQNNLEVPLPEYVRAPTHAHLRTPLSACGIT